jgi:hypothetical protein
MTYFEGVIIYDTANDCFLLLKETDNLYGGTPVVAYTGKLVHHIFKAFVPSAKMIEDCSLQLTFGSNCRVHQTLAGYISGTIERSAKKYHSSCGIEYPKSRCVSDL